MIKFRQIHNASQQADDLALGMVLGIYQKAFAYHPMYAQKIAQLLKFSSNYDFEIILIVAEGVKDRVLGFSLTFYFPDFNLGYLDYLATDPKRNSRGLGTALYENTKEILQKYGCKAILMDTPTDEISKLKEPKLFNINKKRMAFYESLGARPIIGTL